MKSFLKKCISALIILLLILSYGLFFAPETKDTMLYALPDKHALLEKAGSPKIIFIGGSNVGCSLNSKRISEAFRMPVVNMGIHAGIGLKFMLKDVEPYIGKGDVVVVVPEYHHFYDDTHYGDLTLVSLLVDAYPEGVYCLSSRQVCKLILYAFKYSGIKLQKLSLKIWARLTHKNSTSVDFYNRFSFNSYGDIDVHWDKKENFTFKPLYIEPDEEINQELLRDLVAFEKFTKGKEASFILLPPVFQASSYDISQLFIHKIDKDSTILSLNPHFTSRRYRLEDHYFYDTPYHTNKKGVELRTTYIIEDLEWF